VLEAAKKAGAAGELLSQRDLQQLFQQALNPPKEQPAQKVGTEPVVGRGLWIIRAVGTVRGISGPIGWPKCTVVHAAPVTCTLHGSC
jgi:hypothetical protein